MEEDQGFLMHHSTWHKHKIPAEQRIENRAIYVLIQFTMVPSSSIDARCHTNNWCCPPERSLSFSFMCLWILPEHVNLLSTFRSFGIFVEYNTISVSTQASKQASRHEWLYVLRLKELKEGRYQNGGYMRCYSCCRLRLKKIRAVSLMHHSTWNKKSPV